MSAPLVLVWLGTASARAAHDADIASWAISRLVQVDEPAAGTWLAAAGHDDETATKVEYLLSEARTASYSSESAASAALDAAVQLIEAHPALPESAWLMAEACRARAEVVRSTDPDLAESLMRRAVALDGRRAAAFADLEQPPKSARAKPAVASGAAAAPDPVEASPAVPLDGPLPTDSVEIDGIGRAAGSLSVTAGGHHVRVLRNGRIAWAGWITADGGSLRVPVPEVQPCSDVDLSSLRLEGDAVATGHAVTCPRYAVARPAGERGIEVALCSAGSCRTWLPWQRGWGETFEGPAHPPWPQPKSSSWILWTAAGVVGVVATGLVLWRTGTFEHEGPPHETLVFRPPR